MTGRRLPALLAGLAGCLVGVRLAAAADAPAFLAYLQGEAPALVAFNPSGYDPDTYPGGPFPADRLRADLAALRPAFDGLILYDWRAELTPGLLEQAAALGYRAVLLGIWNPRSEAEITGIGELLRRFRDRLSLAVCIGNEGINDNRYRMQDLAQASDRLRTLVGGAAVAVTTSEPSGDYGYPPLLAFGDFYAPNIHPAIDRDGLSPQAAVAWVRGRAEAIARAGGKPVLIKETGLPNGGAEAQSPERQRAFWAAWLAGGRVARVGDPATLVSSAAAFEAFDAPWKVARFGSPIEGRWGLMTVRREPYPAFEVWAAQADPGAGN
jgi:exo-beta-1,3-glucanase (GH17 family)